MEIKQIRQFKRSSVEKFSNLDKMPEAFVLQNENGLRLQVMTYGATVTSLKVPVEDKIIDVVLGFDSLQDYIDSFNLPSAPYLGATVGRYAGRIANGKFVLNGKTFHLNRNSGNHSLHGGSTGLSRVNWKVKSVRDNVNPSITLKYVSPGWEDNFPGDLTVELTYTLSEENEFIVEYKATSTEDTIINLTHHSYFNLDGHESDVRNQNMEINSDKILETDYENIPTGRVLSTNGTIFDFLTSKKCPSKIDTTFVLNNESAAKLFSQNNKLQLSVFTSQPAVHIYVGGNCFNTVKGKNAVDYHKTSGICFETQNFPDAPNHPNFPNSVLRKGETYHHKTIYKFDIK